MSLNDNDSYKSDRLYDKHNCTISSLAVFSMGFKAVAPTSPDGKLIGNVTDEQKKPLNYVS
jgi:hypothetical protein